MTNNIYIKLQKCRVELQEVDLKKSGENKFAKFKYFELKDFLPTINKLMEKYALCSFINFQDNVATLTIVNAENPDETITFTCNTVEVDLKGAIPIQGIGAMQTYVRRYLYMNAFEIVENDVLDSVCGKDVEPAKLSEKQINRLYAIANKAGVKPNQLVASAKKDYGKVNLNELSKDEYDELCERLEKIVK